MMKIGEFEYTGNGELLENNVRYTFFQVTPSLIEAYAEGEGEPVEMNMGAFVSLQRGNLERVNGDILYR